MHVFCAGYWSALTCLKCSPYKNATLHRSIYLMRWVVSSVKASATRTRTIIDWCKPRCAVSNSCSLNDSIIGLNSSVHHHDIPARDACHCRQVLWCFVQQSEGLFDTCYQERRGTRICWSGMNSVLNLGSGSHSLI